MSVDTRLALGAQLPREAMRPYPPAQATPERARVLIVDDDERNLLAIRTVLEDVAEVVVATSGEEALRHLLKSEFAVILLDVFMPGMDGYETAHLIRQRENSKRIPIIFLSAVNKETSHLIRGYSMGAVEPLVLKSKVAVFVDLYEKTREIQRKAAQEQQLLDENLRIQRERLAAEQALRRAEERQALIVQSLPITLYLEPLDAHPRLPQFVGGNFKALTGYDFDYVQQHPTLWLERLHEEDRERVLAALAARLRTGEMAVEYRWRCADGQYKHFLDQAVVLRDADGNPREFAGSLLDVTDRRQLERQLIHAQKMDAIGKLTGGIAHDFNNLLAAVLGGLGLIERRCALDEQGKKIVGMAQHAAEQGTELVRRLLAFARRQQLQPARVPITRLTATMTELLAHTLGGLIHIEWEANPNLWAVHADEGQLELALMNLVINARDAMPEGGTVTISGANRTVEPGTAGELQPGDYVALTVADTGTGIAPELLDSIFEPFFTTKEVGKGTGLGLSMVYGFAQQSGGTVLINSKVGEGTRVELWLPRYMGSSEPSSEDSLASPKVSATKTRPLHVLLVDDHAEVRATTAAWLEELGHSVTDAASGAETLALIEQGLDGLDVIVTDYAMPVISGSELVRRVRDVRPGLAAIIATGYADLTSIANRPEDVVLLSKPFTPEQLDAALRDVTDGSRPRNAVSDQQ